VFFGKRNTEAMQNVRGKVRAPAMGALAPQRGRARENREKNKKQQKNKKTKQNKTKNIKKQNKTKTNKQKQK